jgi:hypothetical protein
VYLGLSYSGLKDKGVEEKLGGGEEMLLPY